MREQERALNWLMSGQASADEAADYVRGIMESGRPCRRMPDSLFWGFDEPETMPADSRVLFYYIPTYLNTDFMMQAFRMFPERVGAILGFANALRRAMVASAGRGFTGADYSKDDFVRGMMIFANVHTKDFIRTYPELVPDDFTVKYYAASRVVERAVRSKEDYLARIENTWENNHLEEYRKIVELENVAARSEYSLDEVMAETFVYLGSVEEDRRIMESDQPWGAEN